MSVRIQFLALSLSALSTLVFGQAPDSLRQCYDSLNNRFDSASRRINNKIDSIQHKANNLLNPNLTVDQPLSQLREGRLAKDSIQVVNELNDLKQLPQQQFDKVNPIAIGSIDEVQRVQGMAGEANGLVDKAQAYQQDAAAIARGDLGDVKAIPEAIENKVASLDEVKELQKQTGEITKYQDMLAKGNDPEALKALAKEQVVKLAIDHFAGKGEALQGAMDKLSKLKSKYSQVTSIKDLPKRVPNPMKEKPFIERIVPGFTLQIQKSSTFMIDISPTIAYRFTGRFTSGAGWNERLSFSEWNVLVSNDRIYGPRVFSSFAFKKGFSLKAEAEKMNVYLPTFTPNVEGSRAWVWSAFVGFKKEYTFYKNVKGNVQVLYNLYDDHDNSPYLDRLNVRMGFEFGMKKKRKIG